MAKWIIGIIVVILIGVGLWYSGVLGTLTPPAAPATNSGQATTTNQQAANQPENGMSATNDTSDTAITQDTAAIDAQMQGLTTDSANIDSSLNDQSVQ
ncbi:MAG: hypothetical protein ABSE76_03000 [Minisyncoccia bacterium]|jgi:cytoskeletal protein RodZ